MLTCFSLENVLNGLKIMIEDKFGRMVKISSLALDTLSGELIHRK
jgi:hypothetical protein